MARTRLGLILAGGKARRYDGQDKGELVLGARRLFDHVYARLTSQVDEIWISGTNDYGSGLTLLPDLDAGPRGPLAGIYAAYSRAVADKNIKGILTVPIDGPAFPENLFDELSAHEGSSIGHDGARRHPTFAYWQITDLEDFFGSRDFNDKLALKTLADHAGAKPVMFKAANAFENINSRQDLLKARSKLS